jgi:hypothetical protein
MAICYLILCHNDAGFVSDLFRYIYEEECIVLLHADAKSPPALHNLIGDIAAGFDNAHALPARSCSWGGYSLTAVALDAISFALRLETKWTHIILLSEQHLPLLRTGDLVQRMEPGVSYAEAQLVSQIYPGGRADIMHRFARSYRELPGVGAFAQHRQQLREDWLRQLYHGSQWVVLSVEACALMLETSKQPALWEPFTQSLLSDETAFPTGLMAGVRSGRLTIRNWNASFIATPGAGGSKDMVFTEENYRHAAAAGKWFIRKRPSVLPPPVRDVLERFAHSSPDEFAARLSRSGAAPRAVPLAVVDNAQLCGALEQTLKTVQPAVIQEVVEGKVHCPDCYVTFRLPHWPAEAFVCLLSADFAQFKVAIVVREQFDGSYAELSRGDRVLSVIKARVYGLFSYREVILGEEVNFGFLSLRAPEDALQLAYMIARHIAAADRLLMMPEAPPGRVPPVLSAQEGAALWPERPAAG